MQWVKEWIAELSVPDGKTGVPLCPFAKKAWDSGLVKVVNTNALWDTVHQEVKSFGTYKVVMCVQDDPQQGYEELEARCDALNNWFVFVGMDIWLLSYQKDKTIVFVQPLSDLDSAAVALEKLGYYAGYSPEDYDRLIQKRRILRKGLDDETLL